METKILLPSHESLKYPFKDISEIKFDFVLIPTKGNFLDGFNNKTGLHIAIVTDQYNILEFNHNGICIGDYKNQRWRQCLQLNFMNYCIDRILEQNDISIKNKMIQLLETKWLEALGMTNNNVQWCKLNYECDNNNCFDFVLAFINSFVNSLTEYDEFKKLNASLINLTCDKVKFCQDFVVPVTKKAAIYISMNRKVNNKIT